MSVQHFLLSLKCGHFYQVSAVRMIEGEPHAPDYKGTVCENARCCDGDHTVTDQVSISRVSGEPSQLAPRLPAVTETP